MGLKSNQSGDDYHKTPGTCKQTGNGAPRYQWIRFPEGRVAKVACLQIAYHLGYDDSFMAKQHEFPPAQDVFDLFCNLLPWFQSHYDDYRIDRAIKNGYSGVMLPFGPEDTQGRLVYCFTKPGRNGNSPRRQTKTPRRYGVSTEHPTSIEQAAPGKLREVYRRCSIEIDNRLKLRKPISKGECLIWGRKGN